MIRIDSKAFDFKRMAKTEILSDADSPARGAAALFATLDPHPKITASDFDIIA